VALAGFGAIGMRVAEELDKGIPGFALTGVSARDREAAAERMDRLSRPVPVVQIEELEPNADLVLECAPAALLPAIARPVLDAGKTLMVLSVAALLETPDLIDLAQARGGRIVVPTGALLGLDAVLAAAEGEIREVRMITRKPPKGLVGAPYLVANDIAVEGISEPLRVFEGSAREAGRGFPANVNVAVALSLAGIGPDRTRIEIWADPTVSRNQHRIEVDADSASFSMAIEGVPSENPKTGRITALSAIAALRKMTAPLAVGT
jgi:aspartate dehydrogenase